MKIVYVGDNRNRGNYGCRATSTALSLLIGEQHEIVGRITGAHTHFDTDELFFKEGWPEWLYKFWGKRKRWKYIKKIFFLYIKLITRGGKYYFSKYDFISCDLEHSIENLRKLIPANSSYKEFDLSQYEFDALVVNGEGSFIFSTPIWRESLVIAMEIYWALKLGKKVYFLNAMFSDDPHSEHNSQMANLVDNLLSRCEVVTVREKMSYEYACTYLPHVKTRIYPDALFTWYDMVNDSHKVDDLKYYIAHSAECDEFYSEVSFVEPYVLIAGSSAGIIGLDFETTINAYCDLVELVKKELKLQVYLIQVCEGDMFLNVVGKKTNSKVIPMETPILAAAKILSNARVFISGRYHPAIMASLGGTPCVFMSSNSHKTLSVQKILEYDNIIEFSVIPNLDECHQIVNMAKSKLKEGDILRMRIKERCRVLSKEAKEIQNLLQ